MTLYYHSNETILFRMKHLLSLGPIEDLQLDRETRTVTDHSTGESYHVPTEWNLT